VEFPTPIMFIERYIQVGAFRVFARGGLAPFQGQKVGLCLLHLFFSLAMDGSFP